MASKDEIKFLTNPNIGKQRKKYCRFRKFGIRHIDYKDPDFLVQFVNDQGKILPRRITGNSLKYQRKVAEAVKRARHLALMPYVTDLLK
jgi:small subunit ribosomal protein S18